MCKGCSQLTYFLAATRLPSKVEGNFTPMRCSNPRRTYVRALVKPSLGNEMLRRCCIVARTFLNAADAMHETAQGCHR